MGGYQPKKTCNNCLKWGICKKCKKDKNVCKKYERLPLKPPATWVDITSQALELAESYTSPPKQRTVLSVRDFATLLSLADREISRMQRDNSYMFFNETEEEHQKRMEEKMKMLQSEPLYQDLLRIREKLGELNIEIETPSVEVE